jgi:hypothetical protein
MSALDRSLPSQLTVVHALRAGHARLRRSRWCTPFGQVTPRWCTPFGQVTPRVDAVLAIDEIYFDPLTT